MLKVGDTFKIADKHGKFTALRIEGQEVIYLLPNGEENWEDPNLCIKYEECPLDKIVAWGMKELDVILSSLESLRNPPRGQNLLPESLRIVPEVHNYGCEDLYIQIPKTSFTLDLCTRDQRCIGKIREQAAWQLTKWHYSPAGRCHPEEYVDEPIGNATSCTTSALQRLVVSCIDELVNSHLDGFWQVYDESYC